MVDDAQDRAPGRAQPPVELEGEQHLRQLRARISAFGLVVPLALEVVQVEVRGLAHEAARGDDAACLRRFEQGHQPVYQHEMPEMVGGEGQFQAVGRLLPGLILQEYARVADDGVEPVDPQSVH